MYDVASVNNSRYKVSSYNAISYKMVIKLVNQSDDIKGEQSFFKGIFDSTMDMLNIKCITRSVLKSDNKIIIDYTLNYKNRTILENNDIISVFDTRHHSFATSLEMS